MVYLAATPDPRAWAAGKQVVVDTKSGRTVAEITGVGGSDESAVNNKLDQYYSPSW